MKCSVFAAVTLSECGESIRLGMVTSAFTVPKPNIDHVRPRSRAEPIPDNCVTACRPTSKGSMHVSEFMQTILQAAMLFPGSYLGQLFIAEGNLWRWNGLTWGVVS